MKGKKRNWIKINAIEGSIVVCPNEIKAFKNHGIDLLQLQRRIQDEIDLEIDKNYDIVCYPK